MRGAVPGTRPGASRALGAAATARSEAASGCSDCGEAGAAVRASSRRRGLVASSPPRRRRRAVAASSLRHRIVVFHLYCYPHPEGGCSDACREGWGCSEGLCEGKAVRAPVRDLEPGT